MKRTLTIITLIFSLFNYSQNIFVDSQTFTPQQLIEDILIDSDCITNINVTNVVGGNFNGADFSYGFFDASGTSFPFTSGIVMSTGRLANVPGPNNSLSDDDAPNWIGDQDLELVLNETNTFNATRRNSIYIFLTFNSSAKFAIMKKNKNYRNIMEFDFLSASLINLAINISYTLISLVVAVYALILIDKKLLKGVDIQQELKNNNLAVAIFASSIMLFVSIIISFGLQS